LTIQRKDREELWRIVNDPSKMNLRLMGDLLHEHHREVESELNRLRFGHNNGSGGGSDGGGASDEVKRRINLLEEQSKALGEVNFDSLPESLLNHIEAMIKKEKDLRTKEDESSNRYSLDKEEEEEEDEDVVEIPVPPKSPAPLVTLDDNGEQVEITVEAHNESSANPTQTRETTNTVNTLKSGSNMRDLSQVIRDCNQAANGAFYGFVNSVWVSDPSPHEMTNLNFLQENGRPHHSSCRNYLPSTSGENGHPLRDDKTSSPRNVGSKNFFSAVQKLKVLAEEEANLCKELAELRTRETQILDRMNGLNENRIQILEKMVGQTRPQLG